MKTKINLSDKLLLEKTLNMHNIVMFIKNRKHYFEIIIYMLYYNRIDVSEITVVSKTSISKEFFYL